MYLFKMAGTMTKKKKRGGKRAGAGRKVANPVEGRTIPIAASVPGSLVKRLDSLASQKGWNRSETIVEAIRGLLDKQKGLAERGGNAKTTHGVSAGRNTKPPKTASQAR
jgi:hypothetical protein